MYFNALLVSLNSRGAFRERLAAPTEPTTITTNAPIPLRPRRFSQHTDFGSEFDEGVGNLVSPALCYVSCMSDFDSHSFFETSESDSFGKANALNGIKTDTELVTFATFSVNSSSFLYA